MIDTDLEPEFTFDELMAEIADLVGGDPVRPPGWVDKYQMAKHWGLSPYTAEGRLARGVEDGTLETMLAHDPGRNNQVVRVWRKVK